jgi:hypothetical protein
MNGLLRLLLVAMLLAPAAANAGLLDDVMNKARQAAEKAANDVTTPETPVGQHAAADADAPPGVAPADDPGLQAPTQAAIELAILHYVPGLLDQESNLKWAIRRVYPDEAKVLDGGNEFEWNRRKDEFRERLLAAAADAPVTFEIDPWREFGKVPVMQLGNYDFGQQAFMVNQFGLRPYLRNQLQDRPNFKWAGKDPDAIKWLRMDASKAEALFAGRPDRQLYPRFTYTITEMQRVDAWRGGAANARNWTPTIAINRMELYAKQAGSHGKAAADFKLIDTLDLSAPD